MSTKKFPIGFWNYPDVDTQSAEDVKLWKNCGMTFNLSPMFDYNRHKKEDLITIINESYKEGISLNLRIAGLDYVSASKDMAAYRELFIRAYNDFGKCPGVHGFFIGDEPVGEEMLNACIEAYKIQLEIAPELTPFLNFMPYSSSYEENILGGKKFNVWAKEFKEKSDCKLICYDCYSQMQPEESGTEIYYLNLRKYSEMAEFAGVELWTTLLSVAHFRYRVPSEDDIRWQLNTAAASGCRGILWFLFYNSLGNNNYRMSPVDELGEITDTYRYMSRVQRIFHIMHGDLLYSLKYKKAYHIKKCYGGYDVFPNNTHPLIKRIDSASLQPGLVSFFEDDEGREFTVLVNNTPKESGLFEFVLDKKCKKVLRYQFNGEKIIDFSVDHHDCVYYEKDDEIHAGVWLAPGQMEIFRFE